MMFVRLILSGDAGELSCNPGGGSPSLRKAKQSIIGSLLTKCLLVLVHFCGLTSGKSNNALVLEPRRVERPNHRRSTKYSCFASSLKSSLSNLVPLLLRCVFKTRSYIKYCTKKIKYAALKSRALFSTFIFCLIFPAYLLLCVAVNNQQ